MVPLPHAKGGSLPGPAFSLDRVASIRLRVSTGADSAQPMA
jgi:hypothetical protein